MAVIGFDVAKDNIVAARVSGNGRLKESFAIANNEDEITSCLEKLKIKYASLLLASEATGDYHVTLAKACLVRKIPFRLINPITTKQFIRATVRRKKTDLTDAEIIARLALQGEGTRVSLNSFCRSKTLHRTAIKLVKVNQTLKLLSKRFVSVLPEEKQLSAKLKLCIGTLSKSCEDFREEARKDTDSELTKLLLSIPGIGKRIVVTLINEIDDIKRFNSPKALVAYAGLDPRVKQSGTSVKHNTHITKRGSPYLRRDIFLAATIAVRWDPQLKAYHRKKLSEGKRYTEALVAVSRKLLNRVYAVWKRGTPYERRLF
jgi:transposase